jgi:hypothetical protein
VRVPTPCTRALTPIPLPWFANHAQQLLRVVGAGPFTRACQKQQSRPCAPLALKAFTRPGNVIAAWGGLAGAANRAWGARRNVAAVTRSGARVTCRRRGQHGSARPFLHGSLEILASSYRSTQSAVYNAATAHDSRRPTAQPGRLSRGAQPALAPNRSRCHAVQVTLCS